MRREPDVLTRRDDPVGDDAALEAAHPVGQHHLRGPADHLEALGEHAHRRGRLLIRGEPDEPEP